MSITDWTTDEWPADIQALAKAVNPSLWRTHVHCSCFGGTDDSPQSVAAFKARSAARKHIDVPTIGHVEQERQTAHEVAWPAPAHPVVTPSTPTVWVPEMDQQSAHEVAWPNCGEFSD